jgi:hypothetical protein
MFLMRAASTAFWSALRSSEISFFCNFTSQPICYSNSTNSSRAWCTNHWLSLSIEEFLLLGLLGLLLLGEVLVVELVQSLNTGQVDLGGGGNDVSGVDSAEWDTVDLEWSADEEETVGEWLEVDNTLATEAAGEDDEDGSWLKRRTESGWSLCLTGLFEIQQLDSCSQISGFVLKSAFPRCCQSCPTPLDFHLLSSRISLSSWLSRTKLISSHTSPNLLPLKAQAFASRLHKLSS